jgi:hypothetical protein
MRKFLRSQICELAVSPISLYREGISVMKITLPGTAAEEAAHSALCRAISAYAWHNAHDELKCHL